MPTRTFKTRAKESDNSVTSASFEVTPGDMIVVLAAVNYTSSTAPNISIADTLGTLTWTEYTRSNTSAGRGNAASIFTATAGATSPGTVTVSANVGTNTMLEVHTIASAGSVLQSANNAGDVDTGNLTLTFGSAAQSASLILAVCGRYEFGGDPGHPGAGSGWTLIFEDHIDPGSTDDLHMATIERTGYTGTTVVFSNTGDDFYTTGVAIEIGAGSFPQTVNCQVGSLVLSGVQPTITEGAISKTAQVATLALAGVNNAFSFFHPGQTGTLAIAGVAGSLNQDTAFVASQVGMLQIAGVPGSTRFPQWFGCQTAELLISGLSGALSVVIPGEPQYSAVPPRAADPAPLTLVTTVTEDVTALLFGSSGIVTRRVDIYEADGITPWALDIPIIEGEVTVDMNRDERRALSLGIYNEGGEFYSDPNGFWYDKVLKVYRGIRNRSIWYETLLGTFAIDTIDSPRFPSTTKIQGRDFSKKLLADNFGQATTFASTTTVEAAITGILVSGGITTYQLPVTGQTLGKDFAFEANVSRWQAIKDIATAFGYQVYFNPRGIFIMEPLTDPTTAALSFTFGTEGDDAVLVDYTKSTNDSRLFNTIPVIGQDANRVPVSYIARNTEPSSPTRIARLGVRSMPPYTSTLVQTVAQAQALAESFLAVMALESYDITMQSLVVPWLEAGTTVRFVDPDPVPGAPTRFLLSDFAIPLSLDSMSARGRRLTVVGAGTE